MSAARSNVALGAAIPVAPSYPSTESSPQSSADRSPPTLVDDNMGGGVGNDEYQHTSSSAPYEPPQYHRAPEDSQEAQKDTSRPLNRETSRFGSVLSAIHSNRSQRARDEDSDSITSFDRAVSRRTESEKEGAWNLEEVLKKDQERNERDGIYPRRLDIGWKDLCVRGVGAETVFAEDIGSLFNPFTGRDDRRRKKLLTQATQEKTDAAPQSSEKAREAAIKELPDYSQYLGKSQRFLLQDFTGCLKSGEMALVLGRPGAGCTTFMKAITNITQGYAGIDGEITYGTMNRKEGERYPGQIIFVGEDEVFYPDLTVDETIKFALKMRTPSQEARPEGVSRHQYEEEFRDRLLKDFGIEHTVDTKVGNEAVRGVSGGERKRVTLAEALVNRAPIIAFDQPTRGLDASTALEYTKSMRTITDYTKTAMFMTAYQAGNQVAELFDKVLVIAAGRCIFWGPMKDARPYFEDMGFVVSPGSNISDYLTAVTVATERVVKDEMKGQVCNTPEEFALAYRQSDIRAKMVKEYEDLMAEEEMRRTRTEDFKKNVQVEKSKRAGKRGPYTTTLFTQIMSATKRQYALTRNDKASFIIKQGGCAFQSIILGSLFYMLPATTAGLFGKSGVLFLIILINCLLGLGEVVESFHGRTILAKHKAMALYRPSALIFAQVIVDIPIVALQVSLFTVPIYFMAGLRKEAGPFFTLWVITYMTTHTLLAFFRMIGFSSNMFQLAGAISGICLNLLIVTMGYLLPPNQLKPWMGWLRWINPLYYALEAAFVNEFRGTTVGCVPPSLVPYGPGYPSSGAGVTCTASGAGEGDTSFSGDAYVAEQFSYYSSHLWRNFGIIIAWWVCYLFFTCLAVERLKAAGSQKSFLVFRRPSKEAEKQLIARVKDTEAEGSNEKGDGQNVNGDEDMQIEKTDTVFAWNNLNYTVNVRGGKKQLLRNIQGFTKPGALVALMGASGAGKTTLLDVLGHRKSEGEVTGEITVDGRPPGPSFQRTCGYVGQMDVHEPTQTIREAFLFSARLRQPAETPDEEIVSYVDKVIDVLELNELADAVIGIPSAGLTIEQRKRTTIGVELVAKPKLLFLDEPTSGLDGQSAYQILRFLKKLSAAGQSMLVTVHQPSALLFEQFDQLILLAKGGRTVYNGSLGKHAADMKAYFKSKGVTIEDESNPAEAMIDIVSGYRSKGKDWAEVWDNSEEAKAMDKEVHQVISEAKEKEPSFKEDGLYYAAPMSRQIRLVMQRSFSSIVRSPDYILSRCGLVIGAGIITGLSFLQMENNYRSVQNRLLAAFQAMFVAPPLFNIIQPRVIEQRTLYESREKQAKMFGWFPWVLALIVTEIPWLLLAQILNWVTWYLISFRPGLLTDPFHAGSFWFQDVMYFMWIGGFAQFVAVLSPTAEAAALFNSIPLSLMSAFAGVLLPYPQMPVWWRYWLYYLNPWSYVLGGKVFFINWNVPIRCDEVELATVQPPSGQTCGQYFESFFTYAAGYVVDPSATSDCQYCPLRSGNEYLESLNLGASYVGWRNIGITAIWVFAFWGFTILAFGFRNRKKKGGQ